MYALFLHCVRWGGEDPGGRRFTPTTTSQLDISAISMRSGVSHYQPTSGNVLGCFSSCVFRCISALLSNVGTTFNDLSYSQAPNGERKVPLRGAHVYEEVEVPVRLRAEAYIGCKASISAFFSRACSCSFAKPNSFLRISQVVQVVLRLERSIVIRSSNSTIIFDHTVSSAPISAPLDHSP